ncbi:MAG TPA: bifunctional tRNA (5-methylaminomethyl-2-thiouridine)(34)-methyltransferase MnmD/FAD-dependent 5-carboxymethylaminomethyl-2-thiouridine(34) oxidoreductase MnmC [Pseudohongiella sp.]|nr:bifunctional tRNA (5-methylaminomethyl-2-thiouridine)(34)-methyltransferase MnmD/FAD-dependent 5-carboxymethylaminomethyl-2-thiouridine(34) oxidoreductase MnmC [Gammaproteobacteria bacterium]HBN14398.1 bifunctional tRNA (5-methylaminomethyl-2-thiouridine)(34)-methyltransferase MnmD/FAD-dependent 5-carboxymethylaminomethyl-2-thiouridine(34) oxidoreductase MnmC [Pseudohongiella sp.]
MSDQSTTDNSALSNAQLQWQEDGAPYSPEYADVYFSREGGLAETHHVFLQANDLLGRWQRLDAELQRSGQKAVFVIAELGFGTGLNFLCTWRLWQQAACQHLRLHYISCEKHPLTLSALKKALQQWPELAEWRDKLLPLYPDHTAGYHRLPLTDITLDLYYGDALTALNAQSNQNASVDAWFLDGFTPARNPELWSDSLLDTIGRLCRPGSTLSSYSVTGRVVRYLRELGFDVDKRPGFGRKRQMLFATYQGQADSVEARQVKGSSMPASALVIGSGLAGATVARALVTRGIKVTVLEKQSQAASGASGNRQAVVQLRRNKQQDQLWAFNTHSYLFALRFYQSLANTSNNAVQWNPCGVLTLDSAYRNTRSSESSSDTYQHYSPQILQTVTAAQTQQLGGVSLDEGGTWLPGGGWINPAASCRICMDHPLINVKTDTSVAALQFSENTQRWQLYDDQNNLIAESACVVVANSYSATALQQTELYPVQPLRGQVSHIPASSTSSQLNSVVCSERYLAPAFDGVHCVGASYVKNSDSAELSETEHQENLEKLGVIASELDLDKGSPLAGRVAFRGSSLDFMPLIGQVPDPVLPEEQYGSTRHLQANVPEQRLPGLYMSIGHGSHGTVSCPMAAEHLAALICNEPSPLPKDAADCVDPIRFIRRLRKRRS